MSRKPDASTQEDPTATSLPLKLACLLDQDDLDGAIEAGLMDYLPDPAHDQLDPAQPDLSTRLADAHRKILAAWAARDRYRARQQRLALRSAEREARRTPPATSGAPALPPTVANILARAKAKAAERSAK